LQGQYNGEICGTRVHDVKFTKNKKIKIKKMNQKKAYKIVLTLYVNVKESFSPPLPNVYTPVTTLCFIRRGKEYSNLR